MKFPLCIMLTPARSSNAVQVLQALSCCQALASIGSDVAVEVGSSSAALRIVGDPLEIKTFEWTRSKLVDSTNREFVQTVSSETGALRSFEFKIRTQVGFRAYSFLSLVRLDGLDEGCVFAVNMCVLSCSQFEFSADIKRMSVLAQRVQRNGSADKELFAFVKGSPESIQNLCDPVTLPHDYDRVLMTYTKKVRC
jgi:cation-transporting ATPase 13A2